MGIDIDAHVDRIEQDGYTIVEDAIDPDLVDALSTTCCSASSVTWAWCRRTTHSRESGPPGSTTCWPTARTFEQIPVHPVILPICERVLDAGLLVSSLSSIAIGPGETPQPIHADDQIIPLAQTPSADSVQHHVGPHRIHRGQRGHPGHPGLPHLGRLA